MCGVIDHRLAQVGRRDLDRVRQTGGELAGDRPSTGGDLEQRALRRAEQDRQAGCKVDGIDVENERDEVAVVQRRNGTCERGS